MDELTQLLQELTQLGTMVIHFDDRVTSVTLNVTEGRIWARRKTGFPVKDLETCLKSIRATCQEWELLE